MATRRWNWRQWVAFAATAVGLLLVGYVGSYAGFYRRGVAEADAFGLPYYFYAPVAGEITRNGPSCQQVWLREFYSPANQVHRLWFGSREACSHITIGPSP